METVLPEDWVEQFSGEMIQNTAAFNSLRKFYSSSVWWEGLVLLPQNSFSANNANLEDVTGDILASSLA